MKHTILLFILTLSCINSFAQFSQQIVISTDAGNARSVYAIDIDSDGDMDVLSTSEGDDKVAWYENINGLGTFGIQQIIDQNLQSAIDVYAEDLDGDGDVDVLAASKGFSAPDGKIVWYENTDGLGNFGPQQNISTLTDGAISVYAIDLDGDDDIDVLSASFVDNKIAWYENTDGLGNFGPQQIITSNALSTRDVYAEDLDGDGDMDVIATSTGEAEVIWFENTDGLGNFGTEQVITNNVIGILSVYAIDIDGDDDIDVLSASLSDDKVAWYENLDGQGTFGPQQVITTNLGGQNDVYAEDLDNDGDIDVLSSSPGSNAIVWYENIDGFGDFGPPQIITTEIEGARKVYASDIDNDGDIDVLSASSTDHKIAWYKNLTILGVNENTIEGFSIYPNPVQGILNIENYSNYTIESIQIYDVLGRLVLAVNHSTNQLDVSFIASGLLFIQLETVKGVLVKNVIKL